MHMHGTIKNNHNYTFFLEEIQIIHSINLHFLNHIFLKYVIVSHITHIYIYIYII